MNLSYEQIKSLIKTTTEIELGNAALRNLYCLSFKIKAAQQTGHL
jgi:hypothetical protein